MPARVDFVQKPTALATEKMLDIAEDVDREGQGGSRALPLRACVVPALVGAGRAERPGRSSNRYDVLVIGVSTGGPQGLKAVIPRLPADFPAPVAIVLHMPIGYTEAYAKRLDDVSELSVVEAREGDEVRPGVVFVAPAGRHLSFKRDRIRSGADLAGRQPAGHAAQAVGGRAV